MRNLLLVCAGLVVVLGVVSAKLWSELRTDRQLIVELQEQMAQTKSAVSAPAPTPVQTLQPIVETKAEPVAPAKIPEPRPAAAVVEAALVAALTNRPATTAAGEEARRTDALRQSEQTATSRVLAWRDRLTIAGQTLTTAQLQALNTVAIAELRRETEESLVIESATTPTDLETVFRLREEAITRQNETNQRILRTVSSQLTAEQTAALRSQFEAGDAARRASFRSEREQITNLNIR